MCLSLTFYRRAPCTWYIDGLGEPNGHRGEGVWGLGRGSWGYKGRGEGVAYLSPEVEIGSEGGEYSSASDWLPACADVWRGAPLPTGPYPGHVPPGVVLVVGGRGRWVREGGGG